jgi:hypothetical protein
VDVPTLLASAGLSVLVSVISAGRVTRRTAKAERDVAAREAVREAVRPTRQELIRWARQGLTDRKPGVVDSSDAKVVSAVLAELPNLPAWRQWLMRRRLRRLFGALWIEHLEVFPYSEDTTWLRALLHESRDMGPTGRPRRLTDGQVHRTLSGTFWGLPAKDLDRQLRRLAACW